MCDYYVALISALDLLKSGNLRNNCSGLKIDWGSPRVLLFTECVIRHYILLFYTSFCRLGLQTIDNGVVSARNLPRPNNLSSDLTDDCVNNFMSFYE